MKIFVAGGNGFVGSAVVRRLHEAGYAVRCLLRTNSNALRIDDLPLERCAGDLLELDSLKNGMSGSSAAIHLAYSTRWSILNSQEQESTAIQGTRNFLEAARSTGVARVVYVSSTAAIGASRHPQVLDEGTPFDLIRHKQLRYANYKHRAEQLCRQAAAEGMDVVVVNPAEAYGPDDRDLVTAGNLVDLASQNPMIVTRGGTCIVHVADVAVGILRAMERGRSGERYILGGDNVSLHQIAALCNELLGLKRPILTLPPMVLQAAVMLARGLRLPSPIEPELVPYATRYWYMDNAKARHELGCHFRSAKSTLEDCLQWLRETDQIPEISRKKGLSNAAVS